MKDFRVELSDDMQVDSKMNNKYNRHEFMQHQSNTARTNQQSPRRGNKCGGCKVAAVCLGLMCVLLLVAITLLWFRICVNKENEGMLSQMDGWTYFRSSMYYLSAETKTWSEARQHCKEKGADLVIINSEEEQTFIDKQFGEAWIGLTDHGSEGVWKWVDGSTMTIGYWRRGEPNSKGDEDCVVTSYKNEKIWSWNDLSCNTDKPWVCERRLFI
ncbi:CD209 antigen-like protein A [Astyanax mexicanus]|uniref:CD209 antigen-like protein A n=1 Tax=Astyanax mexicanus TaxID=7994 RepID=A0A8T2KJ66_ASTMX|nr:CD209 antigen-like protein A [Astyanax mexicanus]